MQSEKSSSFSENDQVSLEEPSGGKPVASLWTRHLLLFFLSFVTFGNSWSYTDPSSLNTSLQLQYGSDDLTFITQLNMLYSFFSIPNIILPILIGFYLSKHPERMGKAMFFCNFLIVAGTGIFALSLSLHLVTRFPLSLVGRVLTGVGTETMTIIQSFYIYRWFYEARDLNFAFAVTTSAMTSSPALNYNLTPIIVENLGIIPDVWISTGICFICLLFGEAIVYIDSRYLPIPLNPVSRKVSKSDTSILDDLETKISPDELGEDEKYQKEDTKRGSESKRSVTSKQGKENSNEVEGNFLQFQSILNCFINEIPSSCYIVIFSFITYRGSTASFIGIQPYYLMSKARYNYSMTYTNLICSIQDMVQAVTNPFIGAFIDYVQHESLFFAAGLFGLFGWFFVQVLPPILTGWPHQVVMLSETNTFLPNPLVLAIFQGLIAVLSGNIGWSLISSLAPEKHQTTVFGLVGALLNLSQAIMPLVMAALTDPELTFEVDMIVLCVITGCSFLSGLFLIYRLSERGATK